MFHTMDHNFPFQTQHKKRRSFNVMCERFQFNVQNTNQISFLLYFLYSNIRINFFFLLSQMIKNDVLIENSFSERWREISRIKPEENLLVHEINYKNLFVHTTLMYKYAINCKITRAYFPSLDMTVPKTLEQHEIVVSMPASSFLAYKRDAVYIGREKNSALMTRLFQLSLFIWHRH